ncbi:MAG: hypothetical protein OEZ22_15035 [Spirochaetia bacterium]|nr:hypothetical protein [Spirochaetia bacterium]
MNRLFLICIYFILTSSIFSLEFTEVHRTKEEKVNLEKLHSELLIIAKQKFDTKRMEELENKSYKEKLSAEETAILRLYFLNQIINTGSGSGPSDINRTVLNKSMEMYESNQSPTEKEEVKIHEEYYKGHKVYTGPKGGRYYINKKGKKVYVTDKMK